MHLDSIFFQIMIYLLAAVISVSIAKRIGLGSVLGYLIAGIVIGPFVLGLVGNEGSDVMHFAEFGVVIMLFLIGLELHPSTLWRMKRLIFGLGGLQIGITTFLISILASLWWLNTAQAITTGLVLALSSTAIVMQTLSEKGLLQTVGSKHSFSVLLMQDIAVVPILAILALFANQVAVSADEVTVVSQGWQQLLLIVGAVLTIIVGGKYLAHFVFRFIAETGQRELFLATALLMVVSVTVAMDAVGLSPALGAFLAGVVLANSEYRYELENTLEPSKGILLGLFFISVGASIDFSLLKEQFVLVIVLLAVLLIVKLIVLFVLGKVFKLNLRQNLLFTFSLAQAGEFGFVLISFASKNGIYDDFTGGILLIVVALSMLITPVLFIINEKIIMPRLSKVDKETEADTIEDNNNPVIIAGFGRFGMVLGRFLNANGIKSTILDINPHNIQYLKKFGYKIYYGDITKPEMLESAGARNAKILVIVMGDRMQIDKLIGVASKNYPHLKLVVRAVDVAHALELQNKGVAAHRQETFESAVSLGADTLDLLGRKKYEAHRSATTFRHQDMKFMKNLQQRYAEDDPHFVMETKRFSEHIENILLMQQKHPYQQMDCAWDTDALIDEAKEQQDEKE